MPVYTYQKRKKQRVHIDVIEKVIDLSLMTHVYEYMFSTRNAPIEANAWAMRQALYRHELLLVIYLKFFLTSVHRQGLLLCNIFRFFLYILTNICSCLSCIGFKLSQIVT